MKAREVNSPASSPSRIPALDGYRALAALGIVAFHVLGFSVILRGHGGAFETIVDGSIGNILDAFFIISGFGLFYRLVLAKGELGSAGWFYWRRATRIYPAYWLMLIVVLVLLSIYIPFHLWNFPPSPHFPPSLLKTLDEFAGFQKVTQLVDATVPIGFIVNGVTWFVTVILCFYLVFPLIARPYYRHPLIGLALAALISIAWKEAIAQTPGIFEAIQTKQSQIFDLTTITAIDQLPGFAFSFGVGMTSAWAYHRLTSTRPRLDLERVALRLLPVAIAGLALAVYLFGHRAAYIAGAYSPTQVRGHLLIPIVWSSAVGFAMLVVLLSPDWIRRPFESRPAHLLSNLSYGIFLIQAPIIWYFAVVFPQWGESQSVLGVASRFLAVLACAMVYAAASRWLVEVPAAKWASRFEQRRRGAAALPEPEATVVNEPVTP